MEQLGVWLLFGAGAFAIAWYQRHRRRDQQVLLARWAHLRDWTYTERDDSWCAAWYGHPFGRSGDRAENVMTGRFGPYRAVVLDYSYPADGWGNRVPTRTRFAVHALRLPARLPWTHLSAESVVDKAAKVVGRQDIELESEEFNRVYRVRSDDPRFASDLLSPRTMELLLRCGGPDIRIGAGYIVLVADGHLDLAAVDAALTVLARVCENIPTFVWRDRNVAPPRPVSRASRR